MICLRRKLKTLSKLGGIFLGNFLILLLFYRDNLEFLKGEELLLILLNEK